MAEMPQRITMHHVRRGVDLLGFVLNDDRDPVLSAGCDCGQVTDVVLEGAQGMPNGATEIAFTCDNCLTPHWITLTLTGDVSRAE